FVNGPPLTLTMTDAPTLLVATASHASTGDGSPGVVRFTRTGAMDQPLTLRLAFDGSARNGTDYGRISETVTIGAGSAEAEIRFVPTESSGSRSAYLVANVHVEPAPDNLVMVGSGSASVVLFDDASRGTGSFAEWKEENFPGIDDPALGGKDADGDGITNLWEYIYGTDPHVRTLLREIDAEVSIAADGHLEVGLRSVAGFTDVHLEAEGSNDLAAWLRADDLELVLRPIPGDANHVRRVYRSIAPVGGDSPAAARRLFRLQAYELPPSATEGGD
ncbi:MAG: hypothetical protein ACR2RV_14300, partial [Verrucomicrobiales bacterium]